jgi:hypothetical protein
MVNQYCQWFWGFHIGKVRKSDTVVMVLGSTWKMRGHPLKNACFPDPTPMSESPVFREFHTSWIKNIVRTQRYHFGPTFSSAFVVYTCIHIMCNVVYGIFLVYIACCILVILAQHIKFPQNGLKMNRLDTKPWLHLIWVPTGRSWYVDLL